MVRRPPISWRSYFADRPDLASLQRAVRWQPGNADYRHRLGRYFFLVQRSPEAAVRVLSRGRGSESASGPLLVRSGGGVSIAGRHGRSRRRRWSSGLDRRLHPLPIWPGKRETSIWCRAKPIRRCGNFAWSWKTIPICRRAALRLCWRVKPDIDALAARCRPAAPECVRRTSWIILVSKKETAAAAKVWAQMVQLHQPLPALVFPTSAT